MNDIDFEKKSVLPVSYFYTGKS